MAASKEEAELLFWERVIHYDNVWAGDFDVSSPRKNSCAAPSPEFWQRFFRDFPPEIRNLVYGHLTPYENSVFNVQRCKNVTTVYRHARTRGIQKYDPRPKWAIHEATPSSSREVKSKLSSLEERFLYELAVHFFSNSEFYLRYRYTSLISDFLTSPCFSSVGAACVPAHHLRRLTIVVGPPESVEDEDLSDTEYEFEVDWKKLFEQGADARRKWWRERLERDWKDIVEAMEGSECQVKIMVLGVPHEETKTVTSWFNRRSRGLLGKDGAVQVVRPSES